SGFTNRNSASGSMCRRMSQGQATRSTAAFSRVIHFMGVVLQRRGVGRAPSRMKVAIAISCGNSYDLAVARPPGRGDSTWSPTMPDPSRRWCLLIHALPARPLYLRARVRRRLAEAGAAPLKKAVYVLPHSAEALDRLRAIAADIRAAGATAFVCEATFADPE